MLNGWDQQRGGADIGSNAATRMDAFILKRAPLAPRYFHYFEAIFGRQIEIRKHSDCV